MRAILCGMADMMHVFDRRTVRERRDRAAPGFSAFDFLFREVGNRLADRLLDVTRQFPRALDLGCHTGALKAALHDGGKIDDLVQCDLSEAMARQAGGLRLVSDEEALPFAESCFDLILSNLSLHWVNDLPGSFVQVRRCLKPDGFFLAAILGGDTLIELRDSLMAAEIEIRDGVSPRLSPFMQISDAGALLQRAGSALPVLAAAHIVDASGHTIRSTAAVESGSDILTWSITVVLTSIDRFMERRTSPSVYMPIRWPSGLTMPVMPRPLADISSNAVVS